MVLAFLSQDLLWANPDIAAPNSYTLATQPLSATIANDLPKMIESELAGIAFRIKNPENRAKLLTRLLNGKHVITLPVKCAGSEIPVEFDFAGAKEPEDPAGAWIIPCAVAGKALEYDAAISFSGEIFEIKIIEKTRSSDEAVKEAARSILKEAGVPEGLPASQYDGGVSIEMLLERGDIKTVVGQILHAYDGKACLADLMRIASNLSPIGFRARGLLYSEDILNYIREHPALMTEENVGLLIGLALNTYEKEGSRDKVIQLLSNLAKKRKELFTEDNLYFLFKMAFPTGHIQSYYDSIIENQKKQFLELLQIFLKANPLSFTNKNWQYVLSLLEEGLHEVATDFFTTEVLPLFKDAFVLAEKTRPGQSGLFSAESLSQFLDSIPLVGTGITNRRNITERILSLFKVNPPAFTESNLLKVLDIIEKRRDTDELWFPASAILPFFAENKNAFTKTVYYRTMEMIRGNDGITYINGLLALHAFYTARGDAVIDEYIEGLMAQYDFGEAVLPRDVFEHLERIYFDILHDLLGLSSTGGQQLVRAVILKRLLVLKEQDMLKREKIGLLKKELLENVIPGIKIVENIYGGCAFFGSGATIYLKPDLNINPGKGSVTVGIMPSQGAELARFLSEVPAGPFDFVKDRTGIYCGAKIQEGPLPVTVHNIRRLLEHGIVEEQDFSPHARGRLMPPFGLTVYYGNCKADLRKEFVLLCAVSSAMAPESANYRQAGGISSPIGIFGHGGEVKTAWGVSMIFVDEYPDTNIDIYTGSPLGALDDKESTAGLCYARYMQFMSYLGFAAAVHTYGPGQISDIYKRFKEDIKERLRQSGLQDDEIKTIFGEAASFSDGGKAGEEESFIKAADLFEKALRSDREYFTALIDTTIIELRDVMFKDPLKRELAILLEESEIDIADIPDYVRKKARSPDESVRETANAILKEAGVPEGPGIERLSGEDKAPGERHKERKSWWTVVFAAVLGYAAARGLGWAYTEFFAMNETYLWLDRLVIAADMALRYLIPIIAGSQYLYWGYKEWKYARLAEHLSQQEIDKRIAPFFGIENIEIVEPEEIGNRPASFGEGRIVKINKNYLLDPRLSVRFRNFRRLTRHEFTHYYFATKRPNGRVPSLIILFLEEVAALANEFEAAYLEWVPRWAKAFIKKPVKLLWLYPIAFLSAGLNPYGVISIKDVYREGRRRELVGSAVRTTFVKALKDMAASTSAAAVSSKDMIEAIKAFKFSPLKPAMSQVQQSHGWATTTYEESERDEILEGLQGKLDQEIFSLLNKYKAYDNFNGSDICLIAASYFEREEKGEESEPWRRFTAWNKLIAHLLSLTPADVEPAALVDAAYWKGIASDGDEAVLMKEIYEEAYGEVYRVYVQYGKSYNIPFRDFKKLGLLKSIIENLRGDMTKWVEAVKVSFINISVNREDRLNEARDAQARAEKARAEQAKTSSKNRQNGEGRSYNAGTGKATSFTLPPFTEGAARAWFDKNWETDARDLLKLYRQKSEIEFLLAAALLELGMELWDRDKEKIRKAYRRLALRYHSDRQGADDTKFKRVQAAWDIVDTFLFANNSGHRTTATPYDAGVRVDILLDRGDIKTVVGQILNAKGGEGYFKDLMAIAAGNDSALRKMARDALELLAKEDGAEKVIGYPAQLAPLVANSMIVMAGYGIPARKSEEFLRHYLTESVAPAGIKKGLEISFGDVIMDRLYYKEAGEEQWGTDLWGRIERNRDGQKAIEEFPRVLEAIAASIIPILCARAESVLIEIGIDPADAHRIVTSRTKNRGAEFDKYGLSAIYKIINEDLLESMAEKGVPRKISEEILFEKLFDHYGYMDASVASFLPVFLNRGATIEELNELLFDKIPLLYESDPYRTVEIMAETLKKGLSFKDVRALYIDVLPSRHGNSLQLAAGSISAAIAMNVEGALWKIPEGELARLRDILYRQIPAEYGEDTYKVFNMIKDLMNAKIGLGKGAAAAREFIYDRISLKYARYFDFSAENVEKFLNAQLVDGFTGIGITEEAAEEIVFCELARRTGWRTSFSGDIAVWKKLPEKLDTFFNDIAILRADISGRTRLAGSTIKRLPEETGDIDTCLASIREGISLFGKERVMKFISAREKARPLDAMVLDDSHQPVFGIIKSFADTLSEGDREAFLKNVFDQVASDASIDYNGSASHRRLIQIIGILGHVAGEGASWREGMLSYDTRDPLFLELRRNLVERGLCFTKWKEFQRLRLLANMMAHRDTLKKIESYLDRGEKGRKIYDYYRFLIFHSSMHNFGALQKMIEDPDQFLGLDDANAPGALHQAKKPSRLLECDYIDLTGQELIHGLILGGLDRCQALQPFSVRIGMEHLDRGLMILKAGQLAQYIVDKGYATEEDVRSALTRLVREGIASLQENRRVEGFAARRERRLNEALNMLESGTPFKKITDALDQRNGFRFDIKKLAGSGLVLYGYTMRIIPKSEPMAMITGDEAPGCMGFGTGKNNVYVFNPNTGFIVLSKEIVGDDGEKTEKVLATSVLTVDRKMPEVITKIYSRLMDRPIEDITAAELFGEDFINRISEEAYISVDNVESAPNTWIQKENGDFERVVRIAYRLFFEEYIKSYPATRRGRAINNQKIPVGRSYADFLKSLPDSEDNYYLMQAPVSYTDKSQSSVGILTLRRKDAEAPAVEPLDGISPLSYEDTLEVAYIENMAFQGREYRNHLAGIEMELTAATYNEALKGPRRRNLSVGYFEKGRLQAYAIAYIGYDRSREEEVIYISDIASLRRQKVSKAGGAVAAALFESIGRTRQEFFERYGKDLKVVFQATTSPDGSYWLFMPRRTDKKAVKEKKEARLERAGLRIAEKTDLGDGRIKIVLTGRVPIKPKAPQTDIHGVNPHMVAGLHERSDEVLAGESMQPVSRSDSDEEIARRLADSILSYALSEKELDLIFEEGLGGYAGRYAAKVFEVIDELKKDEVIGPLLKNVVTHKAKIEDIPSEVCSLKAKGNKIFVFAANNEETRRIFSAGSVDSNARTAYIDEKSAFESGVPLAAYYPLPEIVAATLEKELRGLTVEDLKSLFGLAGVGVEPGSDSSGALIFRILPSIKVYDSEQELIKKYARLKELLRAA